ncbi:MAG: Na+/H+ antiporter NhaA [Desertifilum sp. SIO1I2]|nr:Na+/H+ antiporter NhaA [Desertifilum sp. SIO1I2]
MAFLLLLGLFKRSSVKPKSPSVQYIRIEEGQVFFYLNPLILSEIREGKKQGTPLPLSEELLWNTQQLLAVDVQQTRSYPQSGLTFCTYYVEPQSDSQVPPELSKWREKGQIAVRTVLSLEGEILNQIDCHYLSHPQCLELLRTHHWLVSQMLENLPTEPLSIVRFSTRRLPQAIREALPIGIALLSVAGAVAAIALFYLNIIPLIPASIVIGVLLLYPIYKLIQWLLSVLSEKRVGG